MIRPVEDGDRESVRALLSAVRPGPVDADEALEAVRGEMKVARFWPEIPALCALQHYSAPVHPLLPFAPSMATQVTELLPLEAGRFTDGTMPKLLAVSLFEMALAHPEALGLPVWAFLDIATALKYEPIFRANVEVSRSGERAVIWLPSLGAAITASAGRR